MPNVLKKFSYDIREIEHHTKLCHESRLNDLKLLAKVSVLILSFMSVERFILIAAPLKCHRAMTSQETSLSMIVIWVTGFILAIVPGLFS